MLARQPYQLGDRIALVPLGLMEGIIILLLALAIDLSIGEFPRPLHPVVWMGQLTSLGLKISPRRKHWAQLIYGVAVVVLVLAIFVLATYFLLSYLQGLNTIAYVVVAALLLKSTFSIKELRRSASRIKQLLEGGRLGRARLEVRALVSRDTKNLDEPHLVSATIESVAENTSDSIVSPLLFFILFGVPGAIGYRVVNTIDAMIGYHGRYEYLGKFAARLDDVLNFIPARLSGLVLVAAAYFWGMGGRRAWRVMLRDHAKTESINAGWPMSAAAGALRTRLEKVGHYRLGNANNPLSPRLIPPAVRLMMVSVLLWGGFCLIVEVIRFVLNAQI
jgi:adenosylcobinamide-phosphate synthase